MTIYEAYEKERASVISAVSPPTTAKEARLPGPSQLNATLIPTYLSLHFYFYILHKYIHNMKL
jgi:hypothetical protein